MNNRFRRSTEATLLQEKLGSLARQLQGVASPSGTTTDLVTQEQLVGEAMKILSRFFAGLDEPIFTPRLPFADMPPSVEDYNANFGEIKSDLDTIFTEFENLEGVVLGSFNYMAGRLNRLFSRLKVSSSQLADYALLSNNINKDSIFWSDTFSSVNRIDIGSKLLNATELEIDTSQGIVTLPVERARQKKIVVREQPVINSNSNGMVGNNYELGSSLNADINMILDGNADSWFEYERVVDVDDAVPLVLDFTINLGTPQIVNFIRINPNNFGTKTQITITGIDTSIDGSSYISIKDDIPIAGWAVQDEANVFVLAPSTSKYAGQGLYTFTPRKVKYIHFGLRQTTPYVISTAAGQKLRYAIGLRDVYLEAIPFAATGELVSKAFASTDEIKKVVLLTNQNPPGDFISQLATIQHYLSPDNGSSWYEIRPKVSVGKANTTQDIPELLDFNGVIPSTIKTSDAVSSIRYKTIMKRNGDAFKPGVTGELAQESMAVTELHKPPSTTPFSIELQQTPIADSITLVDPQFGSRGKPDVPYTIATGTGNKLFVQLPWKNIKRSYTKYNNGGTYELLRPGVEEVRVNGDVWTAGDLGSASSTDTVYLINYEQGTIQFGDGTNGKAVPSGSQVNITFGEEQLFPSHAEPHKATLGFATAHDQDEVEIYVVGELAHKVVQLERGARVHKLDPDIVLTGGYTITFSDTSVFQTPVTFVDGSSELSANEYSVDTVNGYLYSYNATSSSTASTVSYYYTPRRRLAKHEWRFSEGSATANTVEILGDAWTTIVPTAPFTIPTAVGHFNLPHLSIVRGSLKFSDTTVFGQEVEYIDGHTELTGTIKVVQQVPSLASGSNTFTLQMPIVSDTSYAISFSDLTVFASEVGTPGSSGEYHVNRSTSQVTVITSAANTSAGTITYYYTNPNFSNAGKYSVNYQTGEVYTYTATGAATTATYSYTDYRAKYPIAREIPVDDFEFDATTRKVSLKDREILRNQRIPQLVASGGRDKYYQVSYQCLKSDRDDISELEPYFSPVLKDYALKVYTKSRLI